MAEHVWRRRLRYLLYREFIYYNYFLVLMSLLLGGLPTYYTGSTRVSGLLCDQKTEDPMQFFFSGCFYLQII